MKPIMPLTSDNLIKYATEGQAMTSSLKVAEVFGKRHDNLIPDIEKIIKRLARLDAIRSAQKAETSANLKSQEILSDVMPAPLKFPPVFKEVTVVVDTANGGTTTIRTFEMNKDAFVLLTFGFTGEKAFMFKLDYIEAFNTMTQRLGEFAHFVETLRPNTKFSVERKKVDNERKMIELANRRLDLIEKGFILNKPRKAKVKAATV